jgi:hypothetical protein
MLPVIPLALRRPNVSGGSEEENMSDSRDDAKLAKLIEIEGYDSIEALMEAVFSDAVSPAICMNEGCDFTCDGSGCRLRSATPTQ